MTLFSRALLLLLGLAMLAWLCVRFGLSDLGVALERVDVGDLLVYACAAVAVVLGYSLRWRLVLRATTTSPPLWRLVAARLAGDAVGALLPGGRVGGDPVRIALTAGDGRGGVRASAAVALDRVMELIGNSICAIVYVSIFSVMRAVGTTQGVPPVLVATVGLPLLALVATVAALRAGRRPFTPVMALAAHVLPPRWRALDAVRQTEDQLIGFFRDHALRFLVGILGSLLIELTIVIEYHFLLLAFGIVLDLPTLLMVLVASGMTRIVPTPGGVGALEAGEVAVLGLAGGRPDVGFLVGLVLRLHETLLTLIGVLLLVAQGMSFARLRVLAARKAVA
jgi:uncharacterized protein (TIRG00374 family)